MTDHEQLLNEKYAGVQTPAYESDCKRLAAGEPLAYVIGWQPFLGLTIYLDSHPLIPRPETEWWTEKLLEHATGAKVFLDLCSGSGVIGCAALKYLPDAEVYFGEIDRAHEQTIQKNIRENALDQRRSHVMIGDLFAPFAGMTFDIIAANPPYIPSGRVLDSSVVDHEPEQALFAGTEGLDLIRRIARDLCNHLTPAGQAWIECDASNIEEAKTLFEAEGFNASIHTDQYGVPRVLVVSFT